MIARTLCFTSAGKLSVRDEQLVWDGADDAHKAMPIEDLGFVILESAQITVTTAALQKLAEQNVALVVCDQTHTPTSQMVAFALADDLMEPFRPFVDQYVFGRGGLSEASTLALTKEARARLLNVLTCDVGLGGYKRPLMVALSYTTASLVRYFKKEGDQLLLPEML